MHTNYSGVKLQQFFNSPHFPTNKLINSLLDENQQKSTIFQQVINTSKGIITNYQSIENKTSIIEMVESGEFFAIDSAKRPPKHAACTKLHIEIKLFYKNLLPYKKNVVLLQIENKTHYFTVESAQPP